MSIVNEKLSGLLEQLSQLEEKRLFFVGGFVKSGTTWVERILDAHPEVICKGEAHFGSLLEPALRDALATYNTLIPKKGNWARHRREGERGASVARYSYMSTDMDVLYARAIQLMLLKWRDAGEARCIGEKTPNNSEYFERFQKLFPDARFLYVVRDVRDVAVSGWFFNLTVDSKRTLETFRDINEYAVYIAGSWTSHVAAGLRFVEQNSGLAACVKYEDLHGAPIEEASRLFKFLGTDTDERTVGRCIASVDFSRLSGGRARGTENRSSFYRKGIVGDWSNHLGTRTISAMESRAGGLMDRLGYE